MKPKLYLIGAGPGALDLLTIRAVKAIEQADVLLYDALVNPDILKYAGSNAVCVYVGKRGRERSIAQEEINRLIVDYVHQNKTIARIKGGDAMVFGRAYAELDVAQGLGIETEVIPGISSFSAMAAEYQLPITMRGVSESFWVLTGTNLHLELSLDVQAAANSKTTMIVYMGMMNLEDVVASIGRYRPSTEPVGLFQQVSTPFSKGVVGTLDTIVALKNQYDFKNPALIVVGSSVLHLYDASRLVNAGG